MGPVIKIYFDNLLYRLFCAYAYFIPLEKILEVLFDIETIFKPYRIIALMIIVTFAFSLQYKWHSNREFKADVFLYIVFGWGIFITFFRMITEYFNFRYFYNDVFQIGLYLIVFIIFRHTKMSMSKVTNILLFLAAGTVTNTIFIFNSFYVLRFFRRESGMMDNPNYLALSLVTVALFMIIYRPIIKGFVKQILWWVVFLFLFYIFMIAGSRSSFLVLILTGLVALYFSPIKEKIILITIISSVVIFGSVVKEDYWQTTGPLILLNRLQKTTESDPRLPAWKGAFRATQATNYIGIGIGQFKGRFPEFYYDENNPLIQRMIARNYFLSLHSDYFTLLVVYGLIGLFCYLIFMYISMKNIVGKIHASLEVKSIFYYRYNLLILMSLIIFGITAESFNSALFWLLLTLSTKIEFE